jgi:hypothetical protein
LGTSLVLEKGSDNEVTITLRLAVAFILLALLSSCGRSRAAADKEVTTLGTTEVTAKLLEIPSPFPPNDLYNYGYVMKYRVLEVHRGKVDGDEIFITHYNPLKPRASVQDEFSKQVGGHLDAFRAGDEHRMALENPVDDYWMGGIIDKYQNSKGVRYWAVWTNPN